VLLARSGKTVTLFERSSKEIGGRARTTEVDGFYFNQGPHALCLTDASDSILKEIGIPFTGGIAGGKGKVYLISNGRKREVPGDYGSWLSSGKSDDSLVEPDESQFFNSPTKMDFSQLEGVTVQEWLDKNIHDVNDAEIIKTILRLNTYANDPDIQSIGSALRQIYVASRRGYMYLDGGWQTFVDGLLTTAKNANVRIVMGKRQQA
jgi:phytoene dehydrogenase-like protein